MSQPESSRSPLVVAREAWIFMGDRLLSGAHERARRNAAQAMVAGMVEAVDAQAVLHNGNDHDIVDGPRLQDQLDTLPLSEKVAFVKEHQEIDGDGISYDFDGIEQAVHEGETSRLGYLYTHFPGSIHSV